MTIIIVKSLEEKIGTEFFRISCNSKNREELLSCCETAAKYAQYSSEEIEEKPFEDNWEYMANYRDTNSGQAAFNHYLKLFCDCKVERLTYDFEYHW